MRAIIFDVETHDVENPEIIEAAWLDLDREPGNIERMQVSRWKPSKPMTLGALATHHILPQWLESCPPSSEFKLPTSVEYICGWNIDFDWLAAGSPNVKRIDLLPICRIIYPNLDCYSQTAMMYHLFGMTEETRDRVREAHESALVDVANCHMIYERVLLDLGGSQGYENLWVFSEECRIPLVMPFGKHLNQPMEDVPQSYRDWYRRCTNPPPDQYILRAFDKFPAKW